MKHDHGSAGVQPAWIREQYPAYTSGSHQMKSVRVANKSGHTIQITNDVPMAIELDEVHFELVQLHFHAPSEHTFEGEHLPIEIHFVHKSAQGKLAVIGAFVEPGAHNPILDPIIAALPSGPGDARHLEPFACDRGS